MVVDHVLVPRHEKLSEEEVKELLRRYSSPKKLPKIKLSDPAIQHLKPKVGDIIRIIRKSPTAGEAIYYRVVEE